jgi:hypothetical protein
MMIAVAVLAVMMGGVAYVVKLRRLQAYYRWRAANLRYAEQSYRHPTYRDEVEDPGAGDHLGQLAEKYERAAAYPWLPIEPDPPAPKP